MEETQMIECVTLSNNHLFSGNPLCEQHRLRYASIIERQGWDVPTVEGMEYDQYDNPAAHYLVWRDNSGQARGVSRLYPTDRSYMLQEVFPHLVTKTDMPKSASVWEGSRFCVDSRLSPEQRKRIIQEIVVGYLEFSLSKQITDIVGVMYPVYWRNIFTKSGWDVDWIGDPQKSAEGHTIIAGRLPVSEHVLTRVRDITGIRSTILNFGEERFRKAA